MVPRLGHALHAVGRALQLTLLIGATSCGVSACGARMDNHRSVVYGAPLTAQLFCSAGPDIHRRRAIEPPKTAVEIRKVAEANVVGNGAHLP